MKFQYIVVAVAVIIAGTSVIWYFTNYDPTPVTSVNTFDINALVIHRLPGMGCPTINCHFPDYYLKINSKSKTVLVGYNICDGDSCVRQDGLSIPLPVADVLHPDYQEPVLPDGLPWKDGDFVDIKIKVPNAFTFDNSSSFDSEHIPKIWVDLGKSEIIRSS